MIFSRSLIRTQAVPQESVSYGRNNPHFPFLFLKVASAPQIASGRFSTALKHSWRHAQAVLAFEESAQFIEARIGLAGECGKSVEERQLILLQRLAGLRHGAPYVPPEHLHLVESSHVVY